MEEYNFIDYSLQLNNIIDYLIDLNYIISILGVSFLGLISGYIFARGIFDAWRS